MSYGFKKYTALPGFRLTLGYTIFYLSIIVLLPLGALALYAAQVGFSGFFKIVLEPRVVASFQLTFTAALAAAIINVIFGTIVAWFLVRVNFPGKKMIDAVVDLPFALPTAVSGIALAMLYSPNGALGKGLAAVGIKVAFTPLGITAALIFIGLPFVIRTVQPALEEVERDLEEAALSLGASRRQILFRVVLPTLLPPVITGFTLAFARAVGEYGSVIFIAGNMPMKTEIASLLIITKLEQYDYAGATVIAVAMLLISLALIFLINLLQTWSGKYLGR